MDSQPFTLFHVAISLIAIVTGFIVVYGLFRANRMSGVTVLFLLTTAATSITGFFFHRDHLLPSHIVGIVALIVMIPTLAALYAFDLRGRWRVVYVIGAIVSLWFNVFVLIAQGFQKVAPLHDLAPTGSEPPFAIAQGIVFVLFIVMTVGALSRSKSI
ncbi:MAG: hypothetical protein ABJB01_06215 [Rudaea sp.]